MERSPIEILFTGFDSAWTPGNRGAIAHARLRGGTLRFVEPVTANFADALTAIEAQSAGTHAQIIGIDQPLIVPNLVGSRPVEAAFRPLLGTVKGAIQPSNRGRLDMFGDGAPIWKFIDDLDASLDWTTSISATSGRHAIEIYPASALIGLFPEFLGRRRAAKYNPGRKTFDLDDWGQVCTLVARTGEELGVYGLPEWATAHASIERPRKSDQDCLDASICVLITYLWWRFGYERSMVVGDLASGYIVTPTNAAMTEVISIRANSLAVPVHPAPIASGERDSVHVRDAVTTDAEAIAVIYNQGIEDRVATLETQTRTAEERAGWLAAREQRHPVLVAVDASGQVVGWGSLNPFNPRPAYAHVADFSIYVNRDQRGRGIGDTLLTALENRARSLGYHKMVLAAFPNNVAGMRLYERHGFTTVGVYREQGRLDDRWVDVILMEKILA